MKIIYPKDNNGNLIGFKTNEKNVYRTSDGVNLSSILKNINDRIDQLNGPFNVADRIYYNENNSTLEMYAGDTLLSSTEVIAGGSDTPLFPPPNAYVIVPPFKLRVDPSLIKPHSTGG